ncbi:Gfo/Idh/MocA family oxidoreductase [Mesorhizobium sp. BR1-1-16]|uniref:Gfo/Idh/MocA family protein n=1 Tax=Mesorhizobium sp. BR1-1-16 TaxID=2876653 RepID=UPI001CC9ECDE|nr:Gfo/Idh/MocA family oxidoreductase [Mesorhizobium sp. BR1-1-16]MBZ9937247.1 Gfo/Idh/MocA family oxidoreductase [Mesorhizobium sp. BR1-1-16]
MHRIGILGAAGIAPRSIIAPARRRSDAIIHAVASRRPGAADAYAKIHGIEAAYESYEALLADPAIDIVYNALPPAGHAEWTEKALAHGKHVLCEKPLAMNATEAAGMVAAAARHDRVLAEAFHDRYHPVFLHLLQLKDAGAFGAIRSLRAEFHVDIPFDPKSIRHDPGQGGGAMMDLGCYPVHWLRAFMAEEPAVISAVAEPNPLGTDQRMVAELMFPGRVTAHLVADIASPPFRGLLRIEGESGTVELDNPCLPHRGHSLREWFGTSYREHTMAGGTTYDYQLEAFIAAVDQGTPLPTGGADSIGNMSTVDAVYDKAIAAGTLASRPARGVATQP